jgi:hypothetical protein
MHNLSATNKAQDGGNQPLAHRTTPVAQVPLASEEGTTQQTFTRKSRQESGLDCLMCAMWGRQRHSPALAESRWHAPSGQGAPISPPPPSSQCSTHKTVKVRFWPWLEPFSVPKSSQRFFWSCLLLSSKLSLPTNFKLSPPHSRWHTPSAQVALTTRYGAVAPTPSGGLGS